jgi:glycosyltransferase involved in cell wall biosynthesis
MISVVTATYNCVNQLPALIESLRAQTDRNFQWVVADGASTDGTLELLRSTTDLDLTVSSQPDFGIYDGLNRAVRNSSSEYYVVAGADDRFAADAIANYREAIARSGADIIAATVMYGPHCFRIKRGPVWLYADKAFIAHHSVGSAFRKDLHLSCGYYSNKLPLGADGLFVLRACKSGATRHEAAFIAGATGQGGASATDWAGAATELFRAQLLTGGSVLVQSLLLLLRIVKGSSRGVRALHDAVLRRS